MKSDIDRASILDRTSFSKSIFDVGLKAVNYHLTINESARNPDVNSNFNHNFEDWVCYSEEELEEMLLKNLGMLFREAISKLVAMGYDDDLVMQAILRNGRCWCGGMDVLSNTLQNVLCFLKDNSSWDSEESETSVADLKQLEEYSLAGMISLLIQERPHLSKGNAMYCLLMSDFHVGRASTLDIPMFLNHNNGYSSVTGNMESVGNNSVGMAPALCKFHGGWGFGNGGGSEFPANGVYSQRGVDVTLQREIEFPKRFDFTPAIKSLLKRNVAMFAAGFKADSKQGQAVLQAGPSCVASGVASTGVVSGVEVPVEQCEESQDSNNQEPFFTPMSPGGVNSVLSKFRDLNLDENFEYVAEDQKDEVILSLIHQIKDLEKQVKDRTEWAHLKAMQAARKLNNDSSELKMLREEREEILRLKKGKQTLEDSTMKRLGEMENALRKASGQGDRANASVRRLELENAEIKAEMEASKLSASESVNTCLEFAKREKKSLKRLLAWEKQKNKLQEEIAEVKGKIAELNQQKIQIEQVHKEVEVKWRQEMKAKELASAQVEEERRSKETTEASNKRKLEALRLKTEIDFQRHKDDHQRLEQELSRLKASAQYADLLHPLITLPTGNSDETNGQGETISMLLHEMELEDSSENGVHSDRECIFCLRDEVSIVFLPCGHQVMCNNCNDDYGKKGKAICPCCQIPIEQRIRVYGASS